MIISLCIIGLVLLGLAAEGGWLTGRGAWLPVEPAKLPCPYASRWAYIPGAERPDLSRAWASTQAHWALEAERQYALAQLRWRGHTPFDAGQPEPAHPAQYRHQARRETLTRAQQAWG